MQSSKEHSFLEEEKAGKLYSSAVDGVTVGLPANAFLFVLPLMALLIYLLRSGLFDKFKSSSSSYAAALPEYSFAYEPPSYGAPPLQEYGPPGRSFDLRVCMINSNLTEEFACSRNFPNNNLNFIRLRSTTS